MCFVKILILFNIKELMIYSFFHITMLIIVSYAKDKNYESISITNDLKINDTYCK